MKKAACASRCVRFGEPLRRAAGRTTAWSRRERARERGEAAARRREEEARAREPKRLLALLRSPRRAAASRASQSRDKRQVRRAAAAGSLAQAVLALLEQREREKSSITSRKRQGTETRTLAALYKDPPPRRRRSGRRPAVLRADLAALARAQLRVADLAQLAVVLAVAVALDDCGRARESVDEVSEASRDRKKERGRDALRCRSSEVETPFVRFVGRKAPARGGRAS